MWQIFLLVLLRLGSCVYSWITEAVCFTFMLHVFACLITLRLIMSFLRLPAKSFKSSCRWRSRFMKKRRKFLRPWTRDCNRSWKESRYVLSAYIKCAVLSDHITYCHARGSAECKFSACCGACGMSFKVVLWVIILMQNVCWVFPNFCIMYCW